jgi:group I intron endonuclease
MGYIYILTSPSGKSYIGQTYRSIQERLREHQKDSSNCVAIYNAIKFHGWENFEKDWYECPDDDLNKHEELMVEVLGTLAPGGYNLKEGGGNGKHSEETKKKISEAQLGEKNHNFGIPMSEEQKQKMRKPKSEDHKRKLSEAHLGKTHSNETKQNISESKKGEKNPNYEKYGEKHHNSKQVYRYDLDGTFIDSFGSCGEAARYLKKTKPNICACANGNRESAHKYKWSYIKY